jgi:hypothetical protein
MTTIHPHPCYNFHLVGRRMGNSDALLEIQDQGMAPVRGPTEVTRRKGQITRAQLRQWWPHHVVLSADKVKGLRNSTTVHDFAKTADYTLSNKTSSNGSNGAPIWGVRSSAAPTTIQIMVSRMEEVAHHR